MDLTTENGASKFITNVGLITSNGPIGHNIMACEWTHQISYSPGKIAVCIKKTNNETVQNIRSSKVFGVNLCAFDQALIPLVAGLNKGTEVDKISALRDLGFLFHPAKHIDVLLVSGASLNAELHLVEELDVGSHTMFIGEVVDVLTNEKESLAYGYHKMGSVIPIPFFSDEKMQEVKKIIEKNRKN